MQGQKPQFSSIPVLRPQEVLNMFENNEILAGPVYTRQKTGGTAFSIKPKDSTNAVRCVFGSIKVPLVTPFGVKLPKDAKDPNRKNIEVYTSDKTHPEYKKLLQTADKWCIKEFHEQSEKYFSKKRGLESITDSYLPMLAYAKKPKDPKAAAKWDPVKAATWEPTHRFKIVTGGDGACHVKKIIGLTKLPSGKTKIEWLPGNADEIAPWSKVIITADLIGGWIAAEFGATWQVTDIMYFPPESRNLPSKHCLDEDEVMDDVESSIMIEQPNLNLIDVKQSEQHKHMILLQQQQLEQDQAELEMQEHQQQQIVNVNIGDNNVSFNAKPMAFDNDDNCDNDTNDINAYINNYNNNKTKNANANAIEDAFVNALINAENASSTTTTKKTNNNNTRKRINTDD